jgi:L,D-transpeptidase ErfK/SrfK
VIAFETAVNRLYSFVTAFAVVALAVLGYGAYRAAVDTRLWRQTLEQTDQLAFSLSQQAVATAAAVQSMRASGEEITFLQGLVNVLPQEKSFVRTQRAMSDEVDLLRSKVGHRVRNDLHVLVDTRANKLYVKRGLTLLWEADCSVGRGGTLKDAKTGRRWEFVTPRGQFEVLGKIEKPLWTKPDWAFVENGEAVPPPEDPKRRVEGELGAYVFNLGDGYLIHGTKNEAVLGHSVSHGCVRLGAVDLKRLYETIPRGARVYIY